MSMITRPSFQVKWHVRQDLININEASLSPRQKLFYSWNLLLVVLLPYFYERSILEQPRRGPRRMFTQYNPSSTKFLCAVFIAYGGTFKSDFLTCLEVAASLTTHHEDLSCFRNFFGGHLLRVSCLLPGGSSRYIF